MVQQFGHLSAKNLVQEFARNIIGNAMTCAFQSVKNVMESVCQSSPTNAMVLVFLETSPVITLAMMTVTSIVMGSALIPDMKKN